MGYDIVQRTAGSHSPIDVIAIHIKRKKIMLLQVKPDSISEKAIMELYKQNWGLSGVFTLRFEVL